MNTWRIDTLSAPAGLAFASRRASDLHDADATLDGHAYFISAPSFDAQLVGSRALAHAAERAGFQVGVFARGEELSFDSLDAVREFVRRVFLSNGPDAIGGGGGGREPRPTPEGGETEPHGESPDEDLLLAFADGLMAFEKMVDGIATPGRSIPTQDAWSRLQVKESPVTGSQFASRLAHIAARLVAESISNQPQKRNAGWDEWRAESTALVHCLDRIRLWPRLRNHPWTKLRLPKAMHEAVRHAHPWDAAWAIRAALLNERLEDYPSPWWVEIEYQANTASPYEDLARIPCPEPLNVEGSTRGVSLAGLLMRGNADPLGVIWGGNTFALTDLFLFSAAQLCAPAVSHHFEGGALWRSTGPMDESFAVLAAETARWMSTNLPRFAYEREVEAIIGRRAVAMPETPWSGGATSSWGSPRSSPGSRSAGA
jgi:hypothetical protein